VVRHPKFHKRYLKIYYFRILSGGTGNKRLFLERKTVTLYPAAILHINIQKVNRNPYRNVDYSVANTQFEIRLGNGYSEILEIFFGGARIMTGSYCYAMPPAFKFSPTHNAVSSHSIL
jgi:hypothetical protein